MLPLAAVIFLLAAACAIPLVHLVRRGYGYHWLIGALGTLAAWISILVSGLRLPETFTTRFSPLTFLSDQNTFPYTLALTTLLFAVALTASVHLRSLDWKSWSSSLAAGACGLLAVLSGTPLTLLVAWAALDLVELAALLTYIQDSSDRERVVTGFAAHVLGLILLLWAILDSRLADTGAGFTDLSATTRLYMIAAAGLRLGVLPLHLPFSHELPMHPVTGSALRMSEAAGSLVLLVRAASIEPALPITMTLLVLTGAAALYGAWGWATIEEGQAARPFWILGTAALSVGAALRGQPEASLAWGAANLLSGGLFFLSTHRHKLIKLELALGMLALSALPFTPTWKGTLLYDFDPDTGRLIGNIILTLVFVLAHALLLAGFFRHLRRIVLPLQASERWITFIYPLGLMLLPAVHFFLGLIDKPSLSDLPTAAWIGGLAAGLTGVLLWRASSTTRKVPGSILAALRRFLSLGWLYRLFWSAYRMAGRAIAGISMILEGEGGFLWALVLLAALASLLLGQGLGR